MRYEELPLLLIYAAIFFCVLPLAEYVYLYKWADINWTFHFLSFQIIMQRSINGDNRLKVMQMLKALENSLLFSFKFKDDFKEFTRCCSHSLSSRK